MNFLFDIFKDIPPEGHLYFFYGITFFFAGISFLITYKRSSELIITSKLWLLASFGITHGTYAWIEIVSLLQNQHSAEIQIFLLNGIKILLFIVSFLFLMQFGLTLISHRISSRRLKLLLSAVPLIFLIVCILLLWGHVVSAGSGLLTEAPYSVQYTFGLAGPLLTSYGLWLFSHEVQSLSTSVTRKLRYAAFVFLFFSVVAGIIPSHVFLPYTYVPVELFRSLSVILITYFILGAINIFDSEMQRKLEKQVRRFEQSEKLISIGRLAAGIAHEINNPLANASLNIEILRDRLKNTDNPEILARLGNAEKNISKAATIAKELLQFSRHTESDMVPVDINSIIESSLTLMKHKFDGRRVRTRLSATPEIIGDPVKLEQVMMNIIDNAQHAMDPGDEIRIESSFRDGLVYISVMDTGRGISQENLSKVFDPFFTTKEIGVGTGLGLSICYGIIDQHGGEITIESNEGEGTMVTITIPAAGHRHI